ncbi:acyl carrier protein [Candidatus Micrarchaeota archaeon]|nr:acyl carrier protein [Candidatus Micrarchaeota archaeon]
MADVEKQFKEIVADIFRVKPSKIKSGTRFIEDLHAKSIDVIALIAATENTFGIKVPSQDANKNKTFGQAVTYIKKKLKKK